MEIERKFRPAEAPDLEGDDGEQIEQGYLALGPGGEVRLRRKGGSPLLTVKMGSGLVREEVEIELSPEQFDALWPLTEGRRLRKRRYLLPLGRRRVELDVYEGDLDGLLTAELEFDDEAEATSFEPPAWLGVEVTGDERFLNERLATAGAP
ncbi:MAG: adenylate cyclase [Actinomycetota bacterium]|nr:adenylate cyclase [Actinomycetota bacterium]